MEAEQNPAKKPSPSLFLPDGGINWQMVSLILFILLVLVIAITLGTENIKR